MYIEKVWNDLYVKISNYCTVEKKKGQIMLKMNGMSNLRRTAAQTLLSFDVVLTADSDSDVLLQIATIYGDVFKKTGFEQNYGLFHLPHLCAFSVSGISKTLQNSGNT